LRVLFAAGGTGGHVFPAIAIADELTRLAREGGLPPPFARVRCDFAGTSTRRESTAVPSAGYSLSVVPVAELARPWASSPTNLTLPFRLAAATRAAMSLVDKLRPHVVVGTGGYVSLPTCVAAVLKRVPLVIQEQNAVPGVANAILARAATTRCAAFASAADALGGKCVVRGNPTRASLRVMTKTVARERLQRPGDENEKVLVVLGGSLGAAAVNDAIAAAAPALLASFPNLRILWQCGEKALAGTREKHAEVTSHPRVLLTPFVRDVDVAYAAADLVVARAGAVTCAELLATRTPSVLIPSPNVAEDHQTANAVEMEANGAATVVREAELREGWIEFAAATKALLVDDERLGRMREAAGRADTPDAARRIAFDVIHAAKKKKK
ncbi:glycosyltransferase family 28 protein, partial [Micromonas pusilla CCMP1545]